MDFLEHDAERGASAVEYGLLIAGIAAVIVAAVIAFGGMTRSVFTDSCTQIVEHSVSPGYDCRAG